jgi:uncharacterized sodium:solute symporter family permease YidK
MSNGSGLVDAGAVDDVVAVAVGVAAAVAVAVGLAVALADAVASVFVVTSTCVVPLADFVMLTDGEAAAATSVVTSMIGGWALSRVLNHIELFRVVVCSS